MIGIFLNRRAIILKQHLMHCNYGVAEEWNFIKDSVLFKSIILLLVKDEIMRERIA